MSLICKWSLVDNKQCFYIKLITVIEIKFHIASIIQTISLKMTQNSVLNITWNCQSDFQSQESTIMKHQASIRMI